LKSFYDVPRLVFHLKVSLFGTMSKDKVEINPLNISFRGLELKKIREKGRKLVGEEVGHKTIKRELGSFTKSGLSFCTIRL